MTDPNDIVARARDLASRMPLYKEHEIQRSCLRECADEIERLRTTLAQHIAEADGRYATLEEIRTANAEVSRLRAEHALLNAVLESAINVPLTKYAHQGGCTCWSCVLADALDAVRKHRAEREGK